VESHQIDLDVSFFTGGNSKNNMQWNSFKYLTSFLFFLLKIPSRPVAWSFADTLNKALLPSDPRHTSEFIYTEIMTCLCVYSGSSVRNLSTKPYSVCDI
jgi:hypothetical protein